MYLAAAGGRELVLRMDLEGLTAPDYAEASGHADLSMALRRMSRQ